MAKNGFSMSKRVAVENIGDDKNLTVNDCGKVFIVGEVNAADGGTLKITLPSHIDAETGWNATFVMESSSYSSAVTWSGSGDTPGFPPFDLYSSTLQSAATDDSSKYDQAATFTIPATVLKTGDKVEIVNVSGALLGFRWNARAITSGALTTT